MYNKYWIAHPWFALVLLIVLLGAMSLGLQGFRLDASTDSLLLEDDPSLQAFKKTQANYPEGEEFIVILYKPDNKNAVSASSIDILHSLTESLKKIEGVSNVRSLLDLPLLYDERLTLTSISKYSQNLLDEGIDLDKAKHHLTQSPLFKDLLINEVGDTLAIQVLLNSNAVLIQAVKERDQTDVVSKSLDLKIAQLRDQEVVNRKRTLTEIRHTIKEHSGSGQYYLGGIPMIVADMIGFIKSDMGSFGVAVLVMIALVLLVMMKSVVWMFVALLCSAASVLLLSGAVGMLRIPITVISSNYAALMMIITMSMLVHVIVRFTEIYSKQSSNIQNSKQSALSDTIINMAVPCFYTAATTAVAFLSLVVSGVRPVIDFGYMMVLGILCCYFVVFVVAPILIALLPVPNKSLSNSSGKGVPLNLLLAMLVQKLKNKWFIVFFVIVALFVVGLTRITVENKFTDYFRSDTEIYQGLIAIDQDLGGTTPMDITINFSRLKENATLNHSESSVLDDDFDDAFDDDFDDDFDEESNDTVAIFSRETMDRVVAVHNYLESLPEVGKVLSLATVVKLAEDIKKSELSHLEMVFMESMIPSELKPVLLTPYYNKDLSEVRFSLRLKETEGKVKRHALLKQIKAGILALDFQPEQVQLTGVAVMYDNLLQSLFASQIKTLVFVFGAITLMLWLLFGSFKIAVIGIIPNIVAACVVLGTMGWIGWPLDIMTITIAAISVGIAVDNTIHYLYKFKEELVSNGYNYTVAMFTSHGSIGRSVFITSLVIVLGFILLMLSKFIPTMIFGALTALAMILALLTSLTLLPQMLMVMKPFKKQ